MRLKQIVENLTDEELMEIYRAPFPKYYGKTLEYACDEILKRGLI